MTGGYLIKRAANGFVVIQEKFMGPGQTMMTVDNESSWIFKSWEETSAWLGMRFMAEQQKPSTVSQFPPQPPV